MKIGYPAINLALLSGRSSHVFRLASYSDDRMTATIAANLSGLKRTLEWNVEHDLMFFRITSNLIPFASHGVSLNYNWRDRFQAELTDLGDYIKRTGLRISLHPGQFVVINSPNETTYRNSVAELIYHADLLSAMGLDTTHKVQIHFGGVHGDLAGSIQVFADRFSQIPDYVQARIVIENDERTASLADCLQIRSLTGAPVLFDIFHHLFRNEGETVLKGLDLAMATWDLVKDGTPMIDYSTQDADKKPGAHAETLDVEHFRAFVTRLKARDVDIMLEIKNKEASALQARIILDDLLSAATVEQDR